jgi:hypothetical protein
MPKFHYFLKLPVELQHMIWTSYLEIEGPTRHCFSRVGDDLLYAAVDVRLKTTFDNLASTNERELWTTTYPRTPLLQKLELSPKGTASVYKPFGFLSNLWLNTQSLQRSPESTGHTLQCPSPVVWVNYTQDVFYFDLVTREDAFPPGYRTWFRMLHQRQDHIFPPSLPDSHWVFNIQKLALRIPLPSWRAAALQSTDADVLQSMKSLRVLTLVYEIPSENSAQRKSAEFTTHNYNSPEGPQRARIRPLWVILFNVNRRELKTELEVMFKKNKQKVDVQLMADPY